MKFTVEYSSVAAYGTIDLLPDDEGKRDVLEQFMQKCAPQLPNGEDYTEMIDESIDRTAVYRLDVESWSGKEGWKDSETLGAYELDSVSMPE